MSEPNKIATNLEEAINAIAERVQVDGDDWRVKVFRRASVAAQNESVAIFDGATSEQILSPEPWLVKFAGGSGRGGIYSFRVVHAKDRNSDRPTAIYQIPSIPGEPLAPNLKIVREPGWTGPATLSYPTEDVPKKNGATRWPGSSDPNTEALRQVPPNGDGGAGPLLALQQERERLSEERHRMEIDAIRRGSEEDRKRLEAKMSDLMEVVKAGQAKPAVDPTSMITTIITAISAAIAPIVPIVLKGREIAADAEAKRLEREEKRDDARQTRENALMEKLASAGQEQAKVIGVFTDSLSTVARSMVQTVAMVGELRQPEPQDDGMMGVLKAAIGAWAESQARQPMIPQPVLQPRPPQPQPRQVVQRVVPASPPMPAQPEHPAEPEAEAGDVEEGEKDGDGQEMSPTEMLDVLADSIRQHTDENDLAPDVVEALTVPEFVEVIKSEGGVLAALQKRLGDEWAKDVANVGYIQRLFTLVGQIASQKGVDVRPVFVA